MNKPVTSSKRKERDSQYIYINCALSLSEIKLHHQLVLLVTILLTQIKLSYNTSMRNKTWKAITISETKYLIQCLSLLPATFGPSDFFFHT